jgi:hypothetical protein
MKTNRCDCGGRMAKWQPIKEIDGLIVGYIKYENEKRTCRKCGATEIRKIKQNNKKLSKNDYSLSDKLSMEIQAAREIYYRNRGKYPEAIILTPKEKEILGNPITYYGMKIQVDDFVTYRFPEVFYLLKYGVDENKKKQ